MAGVTIHSPPAKLALFGFSSTPAKVEVAYRPRSWRMTRALLSIGIAWGIAPVAALLPPHIPWALLAVGAGIYLAVKRWTEAYTLRALEGECPKCGRSQKVDSAGKLKVPRHPITCRGCNHDLLLGVDVGRIAEERLEAARSG